MLWRRAHQHGNASGRTGARATTTGKLVKREMTECGNKERGDIYKTLCENVM